MQLPKDSITTDCQSLQSINIDSLSEWSEKWKLLLNVSKCILLHLHKISISQRDLRPPNSYSLNEAKIPISNIIKILGSHQNLNRSTHDEKGIGREPYHLYKMCIILWVGDWVRVWLNY